MEQRADILVEALEVFINQILYLREVYPSQIFKKRLHYNTAIFVSIYPPLNTYLHNVLRVARYLLQSGQLERAELVVYQNECDVMERYDFQWKHHFQTHTGSDGDTNVMYTDAQLLEFEETLRTAFLKLAERLKPLKPLPNESKFKILLHTTQLEFTKLCNDSHYQDFPWLHEVLMTESTAKDNVALLPIVGIEQMGLRLNALICT